MDENKEVNQEEYLKIKRQNEKEKCIIILLLFAMVLMIIIIGIYFINGKRKEEKKVEPTVAPTIEPTSIPTIEPTPVSTPTKTGVPTATPKPTSSSNMVSTFKYSDENYGLASSGYAIVKGYAEKYNSSIIFHMISTDSADFKKTMEKLDNKDGIPLGCLNDGVISIETAADEFGPSNYTGEEADAYLVYMKTITLSSDVTNKILSSSSSNPITLRLGKAKLTHYINLYEQCRSEITSVELVK